MPIPPVLDELLRAAGPSGSEHDVAAIVRRECAVFADVAGDVNGSTTAIVRGAAGGPLLAVFAHVDEIGMAVTQVTDDGLLAVLRLASWEPATAVGQRVDFLTQGGRVPGVVQRLGDEGELEWAGLFVDIGASTADEALALVTPGDPAVLVGPPVELAGGRVMSKSLDNRVSVFAAVEALRRLAAAPPACDVVLVASVQEEGSGLGAATSAYRLTPDLALVVDVTWATDTPGTNARHHGDQRLGAGVSILRGPTVHPRLAELLIEVATAEGIPYTIEVAKTTQTDADDVHRAGGGVPTAIASIPLRYMHTSSEVVQLSDVDACSSAIEAFARRLEPSLDLVR